MRPVQVSDFNVFPSDQKRESGPRQQYEIVDDDEPNDEFRREFACRSEGRRRHRRHRHHRRLAFGREHEVHPSDVHGLANVFPPDDDHRHLESPEQERDHHDEVHCELRGVVGPMVKAERSQNHAERRVRDRDRAGRVEHVASDELDATVVHDLAQERELRQNRANDELPVVGSIVLTQHRRHYKCYLNNIKYYPKKENIDY